VVWTVGLEQNEHIFKNKKYIYETTGKYLEVTQYKNSFHTMFQYLQNPNLQEPKTIVTITGIRPDFIECLLSLKN
jgi:hypothetical protein